MILKQFQNEKYISVGHYLRRLQIVIHTLTNLPGQSIATKYNLIIVIIIIIVIMIIVIQQ